MNTWIAKHPNWAILISGIVINLIMGIAGMMGGIMLPYTIFYFVTGVPLSTERITVSIISFILIGIIYPVIDKAIKQKGWHWLFAAILIWIPVIGIVILIILPNKKKGAPMG